MCVSETKLKYDLGSAGVFLKDGNTVESKMNWAQFIIGVITFTQYCSHLST